MAATKQDIDRWIETAKKSSYKYVISVCDTFDHDDYPVYCRDEKELKEKTEHYSSAAMQRINEVIKVK